MVPKTRYQVGLFDETDNTQNPILVSEIKHFDSHAEAVAYAMAIPNPGPGHYVEIASYPICENGEPGELEDSAQLIPWRKKKKRARK